MLHTHLFFDFQTFQSGPNLKSPVAVLLLNLGTKVDLDDNVCVCVCGGGHKTGGDNGVWAPKVEKNKDLCVLTDFCIQQTYKTALLSLVLSLLVLSSLSSPLSLHPYPRESVFLPESAKG